MSRYIDVNTLKIPSEEMVAKMIINSAPSIDLDDYVPKDFHDKTCEAMAKRHQEEIADMVRVVRCKECRWWLDGSGLCKHWSKLYGSVLTKADDFCSYGERKEP